MVTQYFHPNIKGRPLLYYEPDFKQPLDLFAGYLTQTGLVIIVTRSYAVQNKIIPGAIVTPARRSNHLVAGAFDCNIKDKAGKLWTSKELESPGGDVLELITLVRDGGIWRWGGDFNTPDGVHFDTGLNIKNPGRWLEIFNELHPGEIA